jgi:hypothetical protein
MSPLHLLGEYEALTQQHQEQFMPTLAHLQSSGTQYCDGVFVGNGWWGIFPTPNSPGG